MILDSSYDQIKARRKAVIHPWSAHWGGEDGIKPVTATGFTEQEVTDSIIDLIKRKRAFHKLRLELEIRAAHKALRNYPV